MATATPTLETIYNSSDQVHDRYLVADGYNTHYLEAGASAGPPLVLLHGAAMEFGLGVDRWYPNVVPLARQLHVYALDELGHGYTDPPRDLERLGHVRYRAEHAIAFIEALGIGPVHLAGQSQGGWIATYITLKRPDLVRKLVLIDSGSTSGSDAGSGDLPYYRLPGIYEPGTRIPAQDLKTREGIRITMAKSLYATEMVTDELIDHLLPLAERWNDRYMARVRKEWADRSETGRRARAEQYDYNGQHISHSVHQLSRPTLVVWGKQTIKGLDPGVELYKKIPGAQMHIFDQANHFLWLDQPRDFNSLVTWFVTQQ